MSDEPNYSAQLLELARNNDYERFVQISSALGGYKDEKLKDLLNSTREDETGNTALHIAALNGSFEVIDLILDVWGSAINPRNNAGETPMHLAVKFAIEDKEYGYFIVHSLIGAGGDINIKANDRSLPEDYVVDDQRLQRLLDDQRMYTYSDSEYTDATGCTDYGTPLISYRGEYDSQISVSTDEYGSD